MNLPTIINYFAGALIIVVLIFVIFYVIMFLRKVVKNAFGKKSDSQMPTYPATQQAIQNWSNPQSLPQQNQIQQQPSQPIQTKPKKSLSKSFSDTLKEFDLDNMEI